MVARFVYRNAIRTNWSIFINSIDDVAPIGSNFNAHMIEQIPKSGITFRPIEKILVSDLRKKWRESKVTLGLDFGL